MTNSWQQLLSTKASSWASCRKTVMQHTQSAATGIWSSYFTFEHVSWITACRACTRQSSIWQSLEITFTPATEKMSMSISNSHSWLSDAEDHLNQSYPLRE